MVIALGMAVAFLTTASGASAATFYVDDSASSPLNPCTSSVPANACLTIGNAVTQARLVPGPNTIQVAAGTYAEAVNLDNAADDGLSINGAGTVTVLTPPAGMVGFTLQRSALTLRDMSINVAANGKGLFLGGIGAVGPQTVDGVTVHMTGGDSDDIAIATNNQPGAKNLSHLDVDDGGNASWTGDALSIASAAPVTVTDSQLQSNEEVVESRGASVALQRVALLTTSSTLGRDVVSVLTGPPIGGRADSSMTIDSSLIIGGQESVVASNLTDTNPQLVAATIRNSTIDPLAPGSGDGQLAVHILGGDSTAAEARVTVDSSIMLRGSAASHPMGASSSITCTYSDLSPGVTFTATPTLGAIECGTAPGNVGHNTTTTPSSNLFVSPFILNWHLRDGSTAIDTGSPAPLAAGESTTDLDGNPRVLNGDGSCPAVRDKGAYEHAAVGADCSPPAATPTGSPPPQTSAPATTCKKKKRKKRAAATAKCKKRKKRGR